MNVNLRRVIPRPRFRTSSLLWLMVVVATFFLGQRSDEIAKRIVQIFGSTWPQAALSYRISGLDDGRVLLVANTAMNRLQVTSPSLVYVRPLEADMIEFSPKSDGVTLVDIWHADGRTSQFELTVAEGKVVSLSEIPSP